MYRKRVYILFCAFFIFNIFGQNNQQKFWILNQTRLSLISGQLPSFFAAYSVRKLSNSYTGPSMEVRRDDNAQADVYFYGGSSVAPESQVKITAKGSSSYNVGDIITFSDFYSATNVFVRTWYDQSGNGHNAQQTTNSSTTQPQIVSGGALITENGRPTLVFKGSHNTMFLTVSPSANLNDGSIFSVYKVDNPSITAGVADNGSYSYNINTYNNSGKLGVTRYGVQDYQTSISYKSGLALASWHKKSTNGFIEIETPNETASVTANFIIGISKIYGNSLSDTQLKISEVFITNYADSNQRQTIFNSQKGFFAIN